MFAMIRDLEFIYYIIAIYIYKYQITMIATSVCIFSRKKIKKHKSQIYRRNEK